MGRKTESAGYNEKDTTTNFYMCRKSNSLVQEINKIHSRGKGLCLFVNINKCIVDVLQWVFVVYCRTKHIQYDVIVRNTQTHLHTDTNFPTIQSALQTGSAVLIRHIHHFLVCRYRPAVSHGRCLGGNKHFRPHSNVVFNLPVLWVFAADIN